ncbi:MAG TPA: hypothetical protein DCS07_13425 [Bdellovibrionales bacterium]|nr:MAG: hypothetical protein A2Z97_09615 [Bdellovibrionales bacterium GWB1_52_6]OFZ03652.1 MAG: hypothetical protein A2X97_00990 [Bdellovibrionales bacterium GWA1_52_35]OFZ41343.1 MAG: hypothetical protein A2070_08960 [Bdellovibrionales bacterium GWC1_52_8]HAR43608.1 hypothetical protein [Bdellovibrionales bacterium]HCM40623.1 hypothetical protein [Bdellovibrionales bacterium]
MQIKSRRSPHTRQSRFKGPKKPEPYKIMHGRENPFPAAWLWLVDQTIPELVKDRYSPRESWKNKPFTQEDAHFFFKGIEELSERFTEERSRGVLNYFLHPKYRSAYLLYFLPLQAAKFLTLFDQNKGAMEAAVDHGLKQGVLRIGDLGAGPGTATLAALLWFLNWADKNKTDLPKIEILWLDTNTTVMDDGRVLVEKLADGFPRLRGKVRLKTVDAPWWEVGRYTENQPFSLLILGHVLNEASGPMSSNSDEGRHEKWIKLWSTLVDLSAGGGMMIVEPASRRTAQNLSQIRDQLFADTLINNEEVRLWGPCLHAGLCPLSGGRDWCHFSFPTQIPGRWFREFSKGLGSERLWLKLSYLWIASAEYPSTVSDPRARRVISDPMGEDRSTLLLCEPEEAIHHKINPRAKIFRGDLIKI